MSAGNAAAQERRQRVVDARAHRLQRELDRHDGLQQADGVPGDDAARLPARSSTPGVPLRLSLGLLLVRRCCTLCAVTVSSNRRKGVPHAVPCTTHCMTLEDYAQTVENPFFEHVASMFLFS